MSLFANSFSRTGADGAEAPTVRRRFASRFCRALCRRRAKSAILKRSSALLAGICFCALSFFFPATVSAEEKDFNQLSIEDVKRLRADHWTVVGKNVIVEGNVYLPVGPLEIFADRFILNLENKDFEASGNVRVARWQELDAPVTLSELADLQNRSKVTVLDVTSEVDLMGDRKYHATVAVQMDNASADRVVGNLTSGYFRLDNVVLSYQSMVCKAKSAEQMPDGVTLVHDGEVSACGYMESSNAHYAVGAKELKIMPHKTHFYGIENIDMDVGDRDVMMTNGMVKVYGIPVLWLPFFFKPKDESLGLCSFQWGKSSEWGYYVNFSKLVTFSEYPDVSARLMGDYFSKRGFGYGVRGQIATEESRTEFLAYSIYDLKPNETDNYRKYRLKVPNSRYDFMVSNVTHITPRLDFRGHFEYSSDRYFRRDFFYSRYQSNPQPATYIALEQQFDHLSAAAYMRFRTNDFYSTVEKLPEIRLDVPRQEILDTGIYYQGDASFDYMQMNWIHFDKRPDVEEYTKLKDYKVARFDTTHFLYYPLRTSYFNLVPRAGFKLTAYSNTSKTKISDEDLLTMFMAADPEGMGEYTFKTYDKKGGADARFAMELGVEMSTKIHNSWQNVRSPFFKIDGIRHVLEPYINYTYIPDPTLDREHIYYFDDIDRIEEQNFIRIGMMNRLQTRAGDTLSTFFSMENYWDIYFQKKDGMSQAGNLGTIMKLKLFEGLSLHTQFLIDLSGDGEVPDTYRNGRNAGKVGLALKWLNQWNFGITYKPAPDWSVSFNYNYLKPYSTRSSYSMGSTLTQINASSYFQRYVSTRNEYFSVTGKMPLTPDHRTLGAVSLAYDIQYGNFDQINFSILRKFHCFQVLALFGFEYQTEKDLDSWDFNYSFQINLTGLNDVMNSVQNNVLRGVDNPNSIFSL